MSAFAPAPAIGSQPSAPSRERASVGVAAFLALAAFSALRYSDLLAGPPRARVLAVAALAALPAVLLAAKPARSSRVWLGILAAVPLTMVALGLALLLLGVPAHLLAPDGWSALGGHVSHGVRVLHRGLWPYRGGDRWARLAVLMVLPCALTLAAFLGLRAARSPSPGRLIAGLAVPLTLYVTGAANTPGSLPALEGLLLLVLLAAWLWLPRMDGAQAIRSGRWLILCGLIALIARPALSSPTPWLDYRDGDLATSSQTTFNWDQTYGPMPWSRSSATMFEVSAPGTRLLRVTALDRFDGLRFLRSDAPPGSLPLDLGGYGRRAWYEPPPGSLALHLGGHGRRAWYHHAIVQIVGLRSPLLVGGGGVATSVQWLAHADPGVVREADGTIRTISGVPESGLYGITSYTPAPSASALRRTPRRFPRAYLPYAQFGLPAAGASGQSLPNATVEARSAPAAGRLVGPSAPGATLASDPLTVRRIEASPYGPMFALAQRLAAQAPSNYDAALAIEHYLRDGYVYDEHVASARFPLEAFLFSERRGYCQQFSGAMALMLRMEGIPARVAVGFAPVLYDPVSGRWRVRALDAHAWVEVFFSGIGWVSFDPTPAAHIVAPPNSATISKAAQLAGSTATRGGHRAVLGARGAGGRGAGGSTGATLGLLLAGAALALALSAACLWVAGRRRLLRALAGEEWAATAELERALAGLGRALPGRTLAALGRELEQDGRAAAGRYVHALAELRYGAAPARPPTPRGRAALRRALSAGGGPSLRLRSLLLMPPGMLAAHGRSGQRRRWRLKHSGSRSVAISAR